MILGSDNFHHSPHFDVVSYNVLPRRFLRRVPEHAEDTLHGGVHRASVEMADRGNSKSWDNIH